jgi:competence protein ComEC
MIGYAIWRMYLITFVLALTTAPLVMYWQNIISPAGILIGPIAILLTSIALLAGFLFMFTAPFGPVSIPFAWLTHRAIGLCEWVVGIADGFESGCWYVGGVPMWWLVGFYGFGIAWLCFPEAVRFAKAIAFLAGWASIGLLLSTMRSNPDELRVTFLSVGHGGCTIIETTDGRVLIYDVGSLAGPEIAKRIVAPFLWSKGIRRIDEIFVSHGDLDHFNGIHDLIRRFRVGQITHTPTFGDKSSPAIAKTLEAIERRGISTRFAVAGDLFSAGDTSMRVLHPPLDYLPGPENVRSLTLSIERGGHTILLTGDLENAGIERVVSQKAQGVDILMTPHHGSATGNVALLASWAKPRFVVSCQGDRDPAKAESVYKNAGIPYWSTSSLGAITIRSHVTGIVVESYATQERVVLRNR